MVLEFAAAAELRFAVAVEDLHHALHMTLLKCSGDNTMILETESGLPAKLTLHARRILSV